MSSTNSSSHLNINMAKTISILSYLTIVGWCIAIVLYGNFKSSEARFHLRQSLGLIISAAVLSLIPFIGWMLNIGVAALWLLGLYYAINSKLVYIPVIGQFFDNHLDFIS